MKKGKILKIVIIIFVLLLAIIGIGIGGTYIKDRKEEKKLINEFDQIYSLINNEKIDFSSINKKLDETVSSGDYKVIEQAAKKYLKDSLANMEKIINILDDEKLTDIITASNYKKDGPLFINTKKYIETTEKSLKESLSTYNLYLSDEKIMSYINGKDIDQYYIDFYKEQLIGEIDKDDNSLTESINQILNILDNYNKIINFLVENKNSWNIEGDHIVFNKDNLSEQYNKYLEQIS